MGKLVSNVTDEALLKMYRIGTLNPTYVLVSPYGKPLLMQLPPGNGKISIMKEPIP